MSTVVTPPMGLIRPSQLDTKYRLGKEGAQARGCNKGKCQKSPVSVQPITFKQL